MKISEQGLYYALGSRAECEAATLQEIDNTDPTRAATARLL
jgi:hypothetical protein